MEGKYGFLEFPAFVSAINSLEHGDHVSITGGGEPTLHPDIIRMLEFIRDVRPDLDVSLVTNGRKFADLSFAEAVLNAAPPRFIVLNSIYSHRPNMHDYIARARGAWRDTVEGMRNALELGIPWESRFIAHRLNYKDMPGYAQFIRDNFPDVTRVVFISIKYTGEAWRNKDLLFVRYSELVPYAVRAVDILEGAGIPVYLYHFPHCVLPRKYWKNTAGVTREDLTEFRILPQCKECAVFDRCSLVWLTYLLAGGEESEFRPIKHL